MMEMKPILDDWQGLFPALSKYTSSTLYMKADFVLIGLRLEKVMSDAYRVVLECLPLWEQEKSRMKVPVFSWELYDKKGIVRLKIDKRIKHFLSVMMHFFVILGEKTD